MEPIWKRIKAQAEENKKSGMPYYCCTEKAIPKMTQAEAIAVLKDVIETIKGYTKSIQAIRGSQLDPECRAQIGTNTQYISRSLTEIELYERISEDEFEKMFPSLNFVTIMEAVSNLERCTQYFVNRGPRYHPHG